MQTSNTSVSLIGQRIAIVGCSGSGKSTLAKRLVEAKGLRYIQSDALFWMPGWVQRPKDDFLRLLEEQVSAESWALDGNIGGRENIVLPRADTVIWLDYSRPFVMRRLLRRTIRRAWTKEPIFHDNAESWRMSFASKDSILLYAWQSHARIRQQYEALWPTLGPSIAKHRICSPNELDALIEEALV